MAKNKRYTVLVEVSFDVVVHPLNSKFKDSIDPKLRDSIIRSCCRVLPLDMASCGTGIDGSYSITLGSVNLLEFEPM